MSNAQTSPVFTPQQTHASCLAMLAVARANGVNPAELELIRRFHADSGSAGTALDPETSEAFSPAAFTSTDDKHLLLTMCLACAFADGSYSPEEKAVVGDIAQQVGVTADQLENISQNVRDQFVGSLASLPDTLGVASLANSLK